jgi:ribonucleoside-triphosphate reductase
MSEIIMDSPSRLLSGITAFRTYARFIAPLSRREVLEETINRSMQMHLDRFPKLSKEILKAFGYVHELKVMPSMRALQFAGDAIIKNNARGFNCSYLSIDSTRSFGETLFLLLSGCGVGFSVQGHHTGQLPYVRGTQEENKFVVHDSIVGWAMALDELIDAYFFGRVRPIFDFSQIRAKGSYLVTTGAKAPGHEPLKRMLNQVEAKLKGAVGRKLRPIEIYDIVCLISDCVLAGGIRRAALICLFDRNDDEMLKAKTGTWWEHSPWRARSNNSVVLPRDEVTEEEFRAIFKITQASGSGEPGFSWTNDKYNIGFNPCHEISLVSKQFCNLTTVNAASIYATGGDKEFLKRVEAAAILGTLQAAYTDFPYLTQQWKENTDRDALLGVSMTGVADNISFLTPELLEKGAKLVLQTNEKIAKKIGINVAQRATALKPEGTASCVLGSSSGVHDRHAEFYIRRIRMNKDDALSRYLKMTIPELVEDDVTSPTGVVVSIPQRSPQGAFIRDQNTAIGLFNRAVMFNRNWVMAGYRGGANHHNVSCTISVRDEEWDGLCDVMWEHRDSYTGISLLPFEDANYQQMPFEACTEAKFHEMNGLVKSIDLRNVLEFEDNTERTEQLACVGGVCSLV